MLEQQPLPFGYTVNLLSALKRLLAGKSAVKPAAPQTLPEFVEQHRAFYGDKPFEVIVDAKGRFSHRPVKLDEQDAKIAEINQARDEAIAAIKWEAMEIAARVRVLEDARPTTIVEENGVPTIKPKRPRKPKADQ